MEERVANAPEPHQFAGILEYTPGRRNILVVYASHSWPMRATNWEHLRSFAEYSDANTYYLNLALEKTPFYLKWVDFDLIIFDTLFITNHWGGRQYFRGLLAKAAPLKQSRAAKVALPQDEFIHSDLLCEFINEFGIDFVFCVSPAEEWPSIYASVDFQRVRFFHVLAGYLDDGKLAGIVEMANASLDRPIDIGYRTAGKPSYWFGRHGFLKQRIAEVFQEWAPRQGLKIDISTLGKDTIYGYDWYRFLARCKYCLGVESGTSILDIDGSIQSRTNAYLRLHPDASFAEVEAACFPGRDGQHTISGFSPRHLEAAATRTCQVLTEGEYGGVMLPGIHYIEVKRDFSNIEEVLALIASDHRRHEMVERTFQDIINSGRFTWRHFAHDIVAQSVGDAERAMDVGSPVLAAIIYHWMRYADAWGWFWIRLFYSRYVRFRTSLRFQARQLAARILSEQVLVRILARLRTRLGSS